MFARSFLILLVLVTDGLLAGSQAVPTSQQPDDFSLTLSASQLTVKTGDPIIVKVIMKNVSERLISVDEDSSPWNNYRVMVQFKDGKEPPTTAFHRLLRGVPSPGDPTMTLGSSAILWSLDPGKTLTDQIDLTKLYSLEPGVYTVQVERTFDHQAPLRSNTITVNVTP